MEFQKEHVDADTLKKEQFKKQAEKKKIEKERELESYKQAIQDNVGKVSEFIPCRKVDEKTKEQILQNTQNTLSKINKDLTKYVPILSYLDHYGLLDGNFDKVLKEVETKATKSLSDVLRNTTRKKGNTKVKDKEESSLKEAALFSLRRKQ